jgi:hypothetical protein
MTLPRKPEPEEELIPANDPHSLPSEYGIFPVTQEMASSWLSYRATHPKLRPLSPGVAAGYQRMMEAGEFAEASPEGLVFDTEGYIISAQHRLKALANADPAKLTRYYGKPFLNFRIFPNESRSIAPYLDQGFRRTAAHLLVGRPYAKDIGSGARLLAALADRDRWGTPRFNQIKVPEIVATADLWPELEWYPAEVWAVWRATRVPSGAHLAVLAQAARTEHREKIPGWLESLRTGVFDAATDPRLRLRERFRGGFVSLGKVPKRDQIYAQVTKAWNAYVTGESLTVLRFMASEELPTVVGFTFKNDTREDAA